MLLKSFRVAKRRRGLVVHQILHNMPGTYPTQSRNVHSLATRTVSPIVEVRWHILWLKGHEGSLGVMLWRALYRVVQCPLRGF